MKNWSLNTESERGTLNHSIKNQTSATNKAIRGSRIYYGDEITPWKTVPNVKRFKIISGDIIPQFTNDYVQKKTNPIIEIEPYKNRRINKYIAHQIRRLGKIRDQWVDAEGLLNKARIARKYFKLTRILNQRSVTFLTSSVVMVFPTWYKVLPMKWLMSIVKKVHEISLQPKRGINLRRVYIEKSNGRKRPLGVPEPEWRIYLNMENNWITFFMKPIMLDSQHGYIPGKGTLTAWKEIATKGLLEKKNILEYDLKNFFGTMQMNVVMNWMILQGIPEDLCDEWALQNAVVPLPNCKSNGYGKERARSIVDKYKNSQEEPVTLGLETEIRNNVVRDTLNRQITEIFGKFYGSQIMPTKYEEHSEWFEATKEVMSWSPSSMKVDPVESWEDIYKSSEYIQAQYKGWNLPLEKFGVQNFWSVDESLYSWGLSRKKLQECKESIWEIPSMNRLKNTILRREWMGRDIIEELNQLFEKKDEALLNILRQFKLRYGKRAYHQADKYEMDNIKEMVKPDPLLNPRVMGFAQGSPTSPVFCNLGKRLILKEMQLQNPEAIIVSYADDGVIFSDKPIVIKDKYYGVEISKEKTKHVKQNNKWIDELVFLGLKWTGYGLVPKNCTDHRRRVIESMKGMVTPIVPGTKQVGFMEEFDRNIARAVMSEGFYEWRLDSFIWEKVKTVETGLLSELRPKEFLEIYNLWTNVGEYDHEYFSGLWLEKNHTVDNITTISGALGGWILAQYWSIKKEEPYEFEWKPNVWLGIKERMGKFWPGWNVYNVSSFAVESLYSIISTQIFKRKVKWTVTVKKQGVNVKKIKSEVSRKELNRVKRKAYLEINW